MRISPPVLLIALLCAVVGFGFNSNSPSTGGGGGGAPVVNPPGGQNNYLPIDNPTFTGLLSGPTATLTTSLTLPGSQSWTNTGIATLSLNLPAGQTWTNAGISMPATLGIQTGAINLINTAAPALLFNGTPMGGTCTGTDFVNAISASGIPSCSTPAGGGGGLPTPVSVANGGLGQGAAPAIADILVASSATEYLPVPMSGDVTVTAAGVTTVNRTLFAPFTNPAGGQNNYAPINAPAFTGTTTMVAAQVANTLSAPTFSSGAITVTTGGILMMAGSAALYFNGVAPGGTCPAGQVVTSISNTIIPTCAAPTVPAGSVTDAMLANAYSGVGACTGGDFVTALNRNAAPTCAAPPGVGTFAPITNPAGGQNNYAPIAAPTFTGAVTAVTLNLTGAAPSLTFSGTPMGGACPAGEFVSTLSNTGVPTCTTPAAGNFAPLANPAGGQNNYPPTASPTFTGTVTAPTINVTTQYELNGTVFGGACPANEFVTAISAGVIPTCAAGGGGGPTLPLSIANGGTGAGTAPTAAQILIAASATVFTPQTVGGDATLAATGALTVHSVNGQAGPFLTGAAGSITDAMLAGAYSGVGACAAGSVATTLVRNAAPTCTSIATLGAPLFAPITVVGTTPPATPVNGQLWFDSTNLQTYIWYTDPTSSQWVAVVNIGAGVWAPFTNPAGGQNNYAPLASPTLTGTTTVTNLTATAIGIGQAAGAAPLAITRNTPGTPANIVVTQSAAGSQSLLDLINDLGNHTYLSNNGSTWPSGTFPYQAPNTTTLESTGAALNLAIGSGLNPINFWAGTNRVAAITQTGLNVLAGDLLYQGTQVGGFTMVLTGSGGGNYSTASSAYVPVDGAGRLTYTITLPVRSILQILVTASAFNTVNTQPACLGIEDTSGMLKVLYTSGSTWTGAALQYETLGDGNAHTYQLAFAACGGSGTAEIANGNNLERPTMTITMRPDSGFDAN